MLRVEQAAALDIESGSRGVRESNMMPRSLGLSRRSGSSGEFSRHPDSARRSSAMSPFLIVIMARWTKNSACGLRRAYTVRLRVHVLHCTPLKVCECASTAVDIGCLALGVDIGFAKSLVKTLITGSCLFRRAERLVHYRVLSILMPRCCLQTYSGPV